jgi:hypothetical protein
LPCLGEHKKMSTFKALVHNRAGNNFIAFESCVRRRPPIFRDDQAQARAMALREPMKIKSNNIKILAEKRGFRGTPFSTIAPGP